MGEGVEGELATVIACTGFTDTTKWESGNGSVPDGVVNGGTSRTGVCEDYRMLAFSGPHTTVGGNLLFCCSVLSFVNAYKARGVSLTRLAKEI